MMGQEHDRRKGRFIRYLSELVQLRLAVENNIRDFDGPHQIIYLADSNVVHLFLSPYNNWMNISPFKEILDQKKEELGVATAIVTAEYLFSRQLAQQKGYPTFVAAEHVEEIIEYFRRLEGQARQGQSGAAARKLPDDSGQIRTNLGAQDPASEIRESLEAIRRQLSGSYDPDKLRDLFGNTIPRTIRLLDDQGLFPKQQFARLQHEDLIRPLRLAPHIDRRRLDNYPEGEIEEWRSTLEAFIHYDGGDDEPEVRLGDVGGYERGFPRHHILNRDATVLTRLFSINADLIERKVPVKLVLITEDEKIHYAVAYREMHKRYGGENFLRRPIQFLPVLNFQEMPNIIFNSNSIDEIKSVSDSILGLKANITRDFLYDLIYRLAVELKKELQPKPEPNLPNWKAALQQAWHKTVESSFEVNIAPHVEIGRAKVKTAWDRVSNNAVSLNVELLARRFRKELGPLAEDIRRIAAGEGAGGLAAAFERFQVEQLDVLERYHIEWCLEWLIADPVRSQAGYIPRGPLLIRQDKLGTAEGVNLAAAIEEVMQCAISNNMAVSLRRILDRYVFTDIVVIASLVAYKHGAWVQARDFAERALARLRKDYRERDQEKTMPRYYGNVYELEYTAAICQRFELSEVVPEQHPTKREKDALRSKFDSARRAHETALAAAQEHFDLFMAARANAELGTLYLTGVAIDLVHPDLRLLQPGEASRFLVLGTEHLRRAGSDLDAHFSDDIGLPTNGRDGKKTDLVTDLYFKVNVNLISAFALFGLEGRYGSIPPPMTKTALEYVRPRLKNFPRHLSVACDICDWIQLDDPAKTRRAREIVAECDRLLSDPAAALTRLDGKELRRFRMHLSKAATAKARVRG